MFDVLTYEKGASVLRMLEQYIGPDVFREGVREYLRTHAYGNADTIDLWTAGPCGQTTGSRCYEWMDLQARLSDLGRPATGRSLEHRTTTVHLSVASSSESTAESAQQWQIPIQLKIIMNGHTEVRRVLLREKRMDLALPSGCASPSY